MDLLPYLQAALLGIVEGITEFLPISSTGHLILMVDLLGFQGPPGKVFEVAIQFGAILAVMWLYRARLLDILQHGWHKGPQQHFAIALLLGVIPAILLGAPLHHAIKEHLYNPGVVAAALILGGFVMLLIERIKPAPKLAESARIEWKDALIIGFGQSIALIPGVSRSGATMMTGLMLGVQRQAAAEFSFFLAMPTMLLATVYDLYKARDGLTETGFGLIAVGFVAAFLTAHIVVRFLLHFLGTHGFAPFAFYRIALGAVILAVLAFA